MEEEVIPLKEGNKEGISLFVPFSRSSRISRISRLF